MEVFKPEMCAFPLRAYVDATRDSVGSEALEEMLRPYGIKASDLEDPTAWYSLEFIEAYMADMLRSCPEPDYLERTTRLGMSAKYMGPFLPLLRALGSPLFAFQQEARAAARFNRLGTWVLQEGRPGFVRIAFQPYPDAPRERGPYFCRIRHIQQGLIPTLFDRPPGTVNHPECVLRGDASCVYEVTWREPPRRRDGLVGALLGVAAGAALAVQHGLPLWSSMAIALAAAIGGWAIGRLRITRRELAARIQEIVDHNQALSVMTRANEDRYAELLEAKAEVDKKVAQRTRELQDATNQLTATLNKLQEIDRAKTDFFNNVSHELRSPLTLILAPLEELIGGRVPSTGQRAVYQTMHRNASRLLRLINQLLDLAKIDAGEMKLATTPTDLLELARASLHAFDAAAHRKGVKLSFQAPPNMTPVSLDASWIESALTNLIANALRWTSRGGVRVIVRDAGTYVTLAVADDGPGIAPDNQRKIFERFAQGESNNRVVGGTGIGLALVREAARLHGGDVELTSELGKGSTFTIKLPRRIDAAALAPRSTASLPAPRELLAEVFEDTPVQSADRKGPSSTAPLVLVVEDNPELCGFIADVLAPQFRVRAASDGRTGVELARQLRPDVIVSDVAMPEMDGYALCRTLRADESTKSVPVLLVTARTDVSNVLEGFEAGASDYLLKPFHGTELLARVGVHVRLRRLTAQLARQERLAAVGSLAASVAHNVRNPLSSLISGLPAMRARLSSVIDRSTDDLLGIMLDCAERIESMTLDLLDLSRIDREVSGDFAPGSGLLTCTRMFAAQLEGVELRSDVDDKIVTSGRAGDMNHVFMNLLDNARRAVGPSGTIEIRGVVEGDFYVVTVGDSGPGIDPGALDHVFEPFWTTRAAGEGTGLGLSIAREIIEEHRGQIIVGTSELGGAQFVVRLPLRAAPRAVA